MFSCGKYSVAAQTTAMACRSHKVIRRSGQILKQLNAADITKKAKKIAAESKENAEESGKQIDMFSVGENQMIDEISKLDVMTMTPIEALQKLFELQKKARGM